MSNKKNECAMLFPNTMNTKGIAVGQSMEEIKKEVEYKKEKIQVILQFSEAPDDMTHIKKEVRDILRQELQKQMKITEGVNAYEESADVVKG